MAEIQQTEEKEEIQDTESVGIKIGKKTIISVLIFIVAILTLLGFRTYNKLFFKTVALTDKKYHTDVVEFSYPKSWVPLGKVFYNPHSIPNLLTYFVATVNPQKIIECQFFSTQMETDNGREFFSTGKTAKVQPEEYFKNAILKMSPTAKNLQLKEKINPSKKELKQANFDKDLLNQIYSETNLGAEKGSSRLDDLTFLPVHYIYEYNEDGKEILHLIEGRFVFFNQIFSRELGDDAPINVSIKFVKCEDVFSYKAEKSLYKKNYGLYKHFKKNLKINEEWTKLATAERQQLLQKLPTITTVSMDGGDKFDTEAFKTTVYNIVYPDETTETMSRYYYGKDLKSFFTKWF